MNRQLECPQVPIRDLPENKRAWGEKPSHCGLAPLQQKGGKHESKENGIGPQKALPGAAWSTASFISRVLWRLVSGGGNGNVEAALNRAGD